MKMNQEEEKYNSVTFLSFSILSFILFICLLFQKIIKIINWFIGPQGIDQHVPEIMKITSRLSKNFGVYLEDFDFRVSRNPILQYQEELLMMANNLLKISTIIFKSPYNPLVLPSSSTNSLTRSSQKDQYNWLLSQRIKEFNFILGKMEEVIIDRFYRYVGSVKLAMVRERSEKKILFQTVEIAESVKKNLKRIEKYLITKWDAPDPDSVYSLVKLEHLKKYGLISDLQYDIRYDSILGKKN